MKGKRVIAGILLAGILVVTWQGVKTQATRKKKRKAVITSVATTIHIQLSE